VEGAVEALSQELQQMAGIRSATVAAAERSDRYKVSVALEPGSDDPGREIAALIIGSGLGLYEMKRSRVSLEDVFLELTTEEKVPEAIDTDPVASEESETSEPEPSKPDLSEQSEGEAV
jgi:ABC-2 type transport system ATP-binding protein